MSQLMQLKDVAESTRLGPLSGEVSAGEILHLVGPNGAGKSTLLARMAGLTSGEGSIRFGGAPLEAWATATLAQHRAYLAQQQNPPFAMPVWHYLTLHQPDKTRTGQLNEVADMLGLGDKLGRSVNQLPVASGSVFALLPLYYKFIPTLIRSVNYCCLMSQ